MGINVVQWYRRTGYIRLCLHRHRHSFLSFDSTKNVEQDIQVHSRRVICEVNALTRLVSMCVI